MIVLSAILMAIALLCLLFFDGGIMAVFAMIFAAFIGAAPFLAKTKLGAMAKWIAVGVGLAGFLLFSLLGRGSGIQTEYGESVARVEEYIKEGKYEKAETVLERIKEDNEDENYLTILEAKIKTGLGDTSGARTILESETTVKEPEYYCAMADLIEAEGGNIEKMAEVLRTGAEIYPESGILNYRAGCLLAGLGNFTGADYYLQRAFALSSDNDPYSAYMLAFVRYTLGDRETAYKLCEIAEECGLFEEEDHEIANLTTWYLQQKEAKKTAEEGKADEN